VSDTQFYVFFAPAALPTMPTNILWFLWASVASKQKLCIHIVEDDEGIRDSTSLLLETLGFQIRAFSSAIEYLNSPPTGAADCLLVDIHMPHMTGVELLELLRSRGVNTPVIIMTGNGAHLKRRVLLAGNCAVLVKPFEESELLAKIAEGCARVNGH